MKLMLLLHIGVLSGPDYSRAYSFMLHGQFPNTVLLYSEPADARLHHLLHTLFLAYSAAAACKRIVAKGVFPLAGFHVTRSLRPNGKLGTTAARQLRLLAVFCRGQGGGPSALQASVHVHSNTYI